MDKSDLILAAIERMYADVVMIKTDVAVLKADVGELKADMVEVKADMVEVKADIGGLKSDFAAMNVRMDRMEADQKFMKQTIGSNHLQVLGRIDQLSDQFVQHLRHHA
jgi:predicted  nucleic acid-binding Zn-ribbon protein